MLVDVLSGLKVGSAEMSKLAKVRVLKIGVLYTICYCVLESHIYMMELYQLMVTLHQFTLCEKYKKGLYMA